MENKVAVLLSTYNGEKYVTELLDSLIKQKGVKVDVFVRDDGSRDNTVKIIKEFKRGRDNIFLFESEKNIGYAKSFLSLLKKCGRYDYYAFCDQDDVWLENKLECAVEFLKDNENDIPLLYTSNVISVDCDLKKINRKSFNGRVINKYESFQRSILPGCTFVFNNKLKEYLIQYNGYVESHDWITYIVASVFGKVFYDTNSYIYYRIHESNTIGLESNFKKFLRKIKRFFKKSSNTRSKVAKDFYIVYENFLEHEIKREIHALAYYRDSYKEKIKLLFSKNFGGIIFKIYVLMNRI